MVLIMFLSPLSIFASASPTHVVDLKQTFEANFTNPIFDKYFEQIANYAQKLEHLPLEFKAIFLSPGETVIEKRLTHKKIVNMLRETFENKDLDSKALAEINALSSAIFTGTFLKNEYEEFLSQYIDLSDEMISSLPLSQLILLYHGQLEESFKNSKYFHEDTTKNDYHLDGFLPSRIYTIDNRHHLHTPNPLIKNKLTNKKTINPTFLSYLDHLKSEKKKHLYVSVKSVREELVKLSQTEEYKDTFILVTLDRGTDFYFQEKGWEEKNNAEEFKENLKKHVFGNHLNFYWPPLLMEHGWVEQTSEFIEKIHNQYFKKSSTLTQVERCAFIETMNAEMIHCLCEFFDPQFVNATCEYTCDRGPSQYVFSYLYDILKRRGQLTIDEKRYLITMFFVPPIIAHNRNAHDYRANRLSETVDILFNVH